MNKICTSPSQSQKLIELGIDIDTADMLWTYDFIINDINGLNVISKHLKPEEDDIPAWSLAALFNVLPDGTDIVKDKADTENEKYMCTVGVKDNIISTFGNNPVDACYETILKLHELNLL